MEEVVQAADVNAAPEVSAPESSSAEQLQQALQAEPVKEEEKVEQDEQPQDQDANLPFGKHPRWQKMLAKNKEYSEKLAALEQRVAVFGDRDPQSLQGILALDQWLREDPQRARQMYDLMMGEKAGQPAEAEAPQEQSDPYEQYAPEVAAKFREVDELKQFVQQLKSQHEEQQKLVQLERQQEVDAHMKDLDKYFDSKLQADGYLDEQGNPLDQDALRLIEGAAQNEFLRIVNEKKWLSKEDIDQVYADLVTKGMTAAEKRALKKVTTHTVPASGSKAGLPAQTKKPMSDDERQSFLLRSLGG